MVLCLLLLCTALLVGVTWTLVLWHLEQPPWDFNLAPPMNAKVFPFRDLCDTAAAEVKVHASVSPTAQHYVEALRQQRARLLHLPADGGAVGERWSAATGLPRPPARAGRTVAAHFVTLSTRTDDFLSTTTTAATMAGVALDVVGVGWAWFTFARRMELVASFLEQAGASEDDVVVSMDADAVLSGEDVQDALAAFAASTAATADEHATYAVRDIRLGRRQPPVLFSAEYNCMHAQAYAQRYLCPTGYDEIDEQMQQWSQRANVSLPSEHRHVNPLRYLNAGVVVARVWALRRVWAAARAFMATHTFYEGDEWWCDQSVYASLYLQLRWWEVGSGALDTATPHSPSAEDQAACPFQPLVLPDPQHGPHGLLGGLIGLDHAGRFCLVISTQVLPKGLLQIGGTATSSDTSPDSALTAYLQGRATMEVGRTTPLRSSHRLTISPRKGVDCEGHDAAGAAPADEPPDCRYRAAVLGITNEEPAITPLIWHFAGKQKRVLLTRFRVVFPWYTPMLWNATLRRDVVGLLAAAPPTRLWYINETTNLPFNNVRHALYPHQDGDDRSFQHLCTLSAVRM